MKNAYGKIKICALLSAVALMLALCGCAREQGASAPTEAPSETVSITDDAPENIESPAPVEDEAGLTYAEEDETFPEAGNTPDVPETSSEPLPEPSASNIPEAEDGPDGLFCTISISCAVLLDHTDELGDTLLELVPETGVLLAPTEAVFSEGESVFDVLQRVCRENGIHLEFSSTPAYGSVYIEGIGNIYEFDCGSLSGWMYMVDGWFPNYGCSQYLLSGGESIRWLYTCDLGADIGGSNFS